MDGASAAELSEFANALIHSRQHMSLRRLHERGPSAEQLLGILGTAAATPEYGKLTPWRFGVEPTAQRERLAEGLG